MKTIITFMSIILGLVLLLGLSAFLYFTPKAEIISDYIVSHPETASILIKRNDTILASQSIHRKQPLASTVKIILAIEYAYQAAAGTIDPQELIPLSDLARYYLPNTDGGAHPAWINSLKASNQLQQESVALQEVAKGMIAFSSNANTEYLMEKLGLELINQRLQKLGLPDHDPLYPIVSALLIAKEIGQEDSLAARLQAMDMATYRQKALAIHQILKEDLKGQYKSEMPQLSFPLQRIWSDRLPAASAADYMQIAQRMNSRAYFPEEVHTYLNPVMEGLMQNPANQQWLQHAGMKGGSTAFVLTLASYATDKAGNKTEIVLMIDDLDMMENAQLQASLNQFALSVMTDGSFRKKLVQSFE